MFYYKIIFLLMLSSLYLTAQSYAAINVNDKDLELSTKFDFNLMIQDNSQTQYFVTANYLHADTENMFVLGAYGEGSFYGNENFLIAFGVQSVFSDEFTAFPFAVKATYTLPVEDYRIPIISLSAEFSYAPSVLSIREADSYSSFRAEVDIEPIPDLHLFMGYRKINTNYKTYDLIFNDNVYIGGKVTF